MLHNISQFGFKVELLCGQGFEPLAPGEPFVVASCDESLRDVMEQRESEVVWHDSSSAGLRFREALPLDARELTQRLEQWRLLPWKEWQG